MRNALEHISSIELIQLTYRENCMRSAPDLLLGLPISMPLVLDMDGTLIAGDMLFKSFIANIRRNPLIAISCAGWLTRGRAFLKSQLAARYHVEWASVQFHKEVVDLAIREKNAGRTVVIATAADVAIATTVASRLGFIDRVFASDGERNYKGAAKARILEEAFPGGFIYAGDSAADLAIWKQASGIVLVNVRESVAEAARKLERPVLELSAHTKVGAALT
jgi:phosphoserine phosphatase